MNTIIVYYSDDYADNGGIGLEEFSTIEESTTWIKKRMSESRDRTIEDYRVFRAEELTIKVVEKV